jgi:hypothetical protein
MLPMSYTYTGLRCDGCGEKDILITAEWAAGDRHYCEQCWPRYRNFYEDEGGQQAWKRIGNRFGARK